MEEQFGSFLVFLIFGGTFLLGFAMLAFWVWSIYDCATKETDEGNIKILWLLLIVLAGCVGSLIYLFVRRPQRKKELGR